jgi:hypothetical protein
MGDGVTSFAPVNQTRYGGASCSADNSQSDFVNILSQEQQSSSGAGQPVCTDPTAPTPREQAARQSLPENERHLPPSLWQLAQGAGTKTPTVGHQTEGIPTNPHLSENARKSAESKSQAPAQGSGGRSWELCLPYISSGCSISSTASVIAGEVKDLAKDAVKGSRVITEGISRGTTAAGDWVSDQANGLASWLDERGHPYLASAARGGGILAATATKTAGEVAGQAVALGPNMVLGLDSAGTNIGEGAARVKLATNSEERWRGIAQIAGGIGEGALVAVDVLSLGEGAAMRSRANAASTIAGGGEDVAARTIARGESHVATSKASGGQGTSTDGYEGFQKMLHEEGAVGNIEPAGNMIQLGEHGGASRNRARLGVSGADVQSAHVAPQGLMKQAPNYNPNHALTRLMENTNHTGMDHLWKHEFDALRDARRAAGQPTTATVQEVNDVIARAIDRAPGLPPGEKKSLIARLQDEVFKESGFNPTDVVEIPRGFKR